MTLKNTEKLAEKQLFYGLLIIDKNVLKFGGQIQKLSGPNVAPWRFVKRDTAPPMGGPSNLQMSQEPPV